MSGHARRTALLGGIGAAALLLLAAPGPAAAVRALREPIPGDPTAPVVALGSLLGWLLTAWLLATVALTAAGHLPGMAGRAGRVVARRVAPATVRRTVEVALGLTVAVGVVGASPAAASPGPAAPAPAAVSLDWAAAPQPTTPATDLDWTATPAADAAVVVTPGDSLWAIAEQDLAARTGGTPTEAEVAQAWPSWWAANRDTVGDDPDLIQPGLRLEPPAEGSAPS